MATSGCPSIHPHPPPNCLCLSQVYITTMMQKFEIIFTKTLTIMANSVFAKRTDHRVLIKAFELVQNINHQEIQKESTSKLRE